MGGVSSVLGEIVAMGVTLYSHLDAHLRPVADPTEYA